MPTVPFNAASGAIDYDKFISAAEKGELEKVREILDAGADIDFVSGSDMTALSWAIFGGHEKLFDYLLERGADIDLCDGETRETPLMWAVEGRHVSMVEKLLARHAKVDAQDFEGDTALMYAAFEGHADMARKLLEKGAKIEITNARGKTAADKAAETTRGEGRAVVDVLNEFVALRQEHARNAELNIQACREGLHTGIKVRKSPFRIRPLVES